MKKTLLLGALAMGIFFTSCGTGSASLKTGKDSVSYAIGVFSGKQAQNFDSTINVDVVIAAIRDVFAKKSDSIMTIEQAQAQVQAYMMVKQEEEMKTAKVKFTKDSADNVAAEVKFLAEKEKEGYKKTASGLLYKIGNEGTAPKAEIGDTLSVHYTLTLPNGTKIDSSLDRGATMDFTNEEDGMIKGFTEGMSLLGKGGKATLVLPYELGYGINGNGRGVGPCQTLIFEVEMVDIKKAKK